MKYQVFIKSNDHLDRWCENFQLPDIDSSCCRYCLSNSLYHWNGSEILVYLNVTLVRSMLHRVFATVRITVIFKSFILHNHCMVEVLIEIAYTVNPRWNSSWYLGTKGCIVSSWFRAIWSPVRIFRAAYSDTIMDALW